MSEFTPGPWRVGMKNGHNANIVFNENDKGIAAVYGLALHRKVDEQPEDAAEEIANANLLAAAPELYEALDVLTLVVGLTPILGDKAALQEAVDIARATLKKARGE